VLEPTIDILSGLGRDKPAGQVLIGFAAETQDLADNAQAKLERKNADFIVANDVSAPGVGFGHETNAVTIYGADGSALEVALRGKDGVAGAILDCVGLKLVQDS
jgi:phosphopantothenoylcysteine decarboxylase / phosphopantothenate---cysteine ligase